MAKVDFKTHGTLEIQAEIAFTHPLEAKENWVMIGPQYKLGDRITIMVGGHIFGVVHGFVTQPGNSLQVLI